MNLILFEKALTFLLLSYVALMATPLNSGDRLCPFFWTQTSKDTATGVYGVAKVGGKSQTGTIAYDSVTFRLERAPWWNQLVTRVITQITLDFSTIKPDSIDLCANKFLAVPWIRSITGNTDSSAYSIRFLFPILPLGQSYGRYDYFTVRFNDTMDVHFQGISDSVFAGSFVNRRIPGSKTVIYAKNAIAVLTTSTNALRIKTVQIDSTYKQLTSAYLRLNLSALKSGVGYYGASIIDTVLTGPPPPKGLRTNSILR